LIQFVQKLETEPEEEAAPEEPPTEKECPYCKTTIPYGAVRCPNCTTHLEEGEPA
ncbi:MAG: large conductance mechanosensitive channel protein MscL, partial [Anaerolineae bacterium]